MSEESLVVVDETVDQKNDDEEEDEDFDFDLDVIDDILDDIDDNATKMGQPMQDVRIPYESVDDEFMPSEPGTEIPEAPEAPETPEVNETTPLEPMHVVGEEGLIYFAGWLGKGRKNM